ncbi:MFS general substrate transporter [Trametes elegans]|nr:MFS general substrate transporter [Trametes elegans]
MAGNTPPSLTKTDSAEKVIGTGMRKLPSTNPIHGRTQPPPTPVYSVYTSREKWMIVAVTSFAALFSPLTANIYFPAIPDIAAAFNVSIELINLTVTVYMVLQGLSPMFWGTLSDRWGRRPMFIGCMVVLCVACVGLALVPTDAYWLLMVLRCLQSAGCASTVALGAGVIADVAAPAERGTFFGMWNIGPMVGPCLGPVLGGVLADKLGWRSIFWFLCISSGVCAVIMVLILPETLRAMVGNGSIPPPRAYKPLIPILGRTAHSTTDGDDAQRPPRRAFANPLLLFTYPDVTLILVFNGLVYAVYYGVTTTISPLFQPAYPFLNETTTGLCFLAIGGGMLVGGVVSGKVLDHEYRRFRDRLLRQAEAQAEAETGMDPERKARPRDLTAANMDEWFPIEYARLRLMPALVAVYVAACVGYGWALQARVHIACPLVLQFVVGCMCMSIMNCAQTLLVDLAPAHSSAITACNNLVRCSLGAVCVSVIDLILKALGTGWTYVVLAGVCVVCSPACWLVIRYGPAWRAKRRATAK